MSIFGMGPVGQLIGYSRVREKITFDMLESEKYTVAIEYNTKLTILYQL